MDSSLFKGYNFYKQIECVIQFVKDHEHREYFGESDRRSIKRSSRKWEGEGGSHELTLIN